MIRNSEKKIHINIHQDSQFFPISYLNEYKEIKDHNKMMDWCFYDHDDEDKIIDLLYRFGIEIEDGSEIGNFEFIFSGDEFIELEIKEI